MNFIAELESTGYKVDMMVIQCGTGENGPMRMESRARDRGRPFVVKEARVRFERGQIRTIHIKGLDFVAVCPPRFHVSCEQDKGWRKADVHAENRGMLVDT